MSLYESVRGRPLTARDPSGREIVFDSLLFNKMYLLGVPKAKKRFEVNGRVALYGNVEGDGTPESEIIAAMIRSTRRFSLRGKSRADEQDALSAHVGVRLSTVQRAKTFEVRFASSKAPYKFNEEHWQYDKGLPRVKVVVDADSGLLRAPILKELRAGVWDMWDDQGKMKYAIQCQQGLYAVMVAGSLSGPDEQLNELRTGNGLNTMFNNFHLSQDFGPHYGLDDKIPGDGFYIMNGATLKDENDVPLEERGQNLIFLGGADEEFWGHGGETDTWDVWMTRVANAIPTGVRFGVWWG